MGVQTLDFRSLLHCYGTRPLLHWAIGQSARGALGAAPRIRDGLEGIRLCNWLTHPLLPPCFCTAITDQLIYQRPNTAGASAHNLLRLVDHLSMREDPQLATVQPDGDRITFTQSKDTAKLHGTTTRPRPSILVTICFISHQYSPTTVPPSPPVTPVSALPH